MADFIQELTRIVEANEWIVHVDGSSTINRSGAGIVITSPKGDELEFVVNFKFRASNNKVEYEALIRK